MGLRRSALIPAVLVVALGLVAGSCTTDGDQRSAPPNGDPTASTDRSDGPDDAADLLWAVSGEGSLDGDRLGITLRSDDVSWITDRPERKAGQVHPTAFVSTWAARGFTEDPPNAVLMNGGNEAAVELTDPSYDPGTRRFEVHVRPIDGATLPSSVTGPTELFIDADTTCVFDPTIFYVENAPPTLQWPWNAQYDMSCWEASNQAAEAVQAAFRAVPTTTTTLPEWEQFDISQGLMVPPPQAPAGPPPVVTVDMFGLTWSCRFTPYTGDMQQFVAGWNGLDTPYQPQFSTECTVPAQGADGPTLWLIG